MPTANHPDPDRKHPLNLSTWGSRYEAGAATSGVLEGEIVQTRFMGSALGPFHLTGTIEAGGRQFSFDTECLSRDLEIDAINEGTRLRFRADAQGRVREVESYELSTRLLAARDRTQNVHHSGYGLVIPYYSPFRTDDMAQVATLEGQHFVMVAHHLRKPRYDFNLLAPGTLVRYNANATGCIVGIESHAAPAQGRVVGRSWRNNTYTVRNTGTRDKVVLRQEQNTPMWRGLCLGAKVSFHPLPDNPAEGRFAYVQAVPPPVAAWRIASSLARSPLLLLEMGQALAARLRRPFGPKAE